MSIYIQERKGRGCVLGEGLEYRRDGRFVRGNSGGRSVVMESKLIVM